MNKLTNYQIDLISKVKEKLSRCHNRDHHIILQVHTHIQSLQATGIGEEVLEHWLQQKQLKYLDKVFYFEGKIYDFNNRWSQRYSKTNRHKKWQKVTKFHSKY